MNLSLKNAIATALLVAVSSHSLSAFAIFEDRVAFDKMQKETIADFEHMRSERESRLYYKLGGAKVISEPPQTQADLRIGGTAVLGPGYSCGKFNPTASLTNFINDIKDGIDNAANVAQQAATSAISALPMYLIQRNQPGMYEMLQNNIFRAEEKWRISAASCEEMERQIAQGKNPYKKYVEMAQGETLQEESLSNPDANSAMKKVATEGGDRGITLPKPGEGIGKLGGKNQPPIEPGKIGAVVGYNMLIDRSNITAISKPTTKSHITHHFESPTAMYEWLASVVGDNEIYTTDSPRKAPITTAGTGVGIKAARSQEEIKKVLSKAVTKRSPTDREEVLQELSTSIDITPDLIKRIQDLSPGGRMLAVHNLSGELALSAEIEKALLVRRALMVSLSEPNIANANAMREDVIKKIQDLEHEIESAMFEYRLRKELVSDLAGIVYEEEPTGTSETDFEEPKTSPSLENE